MFQRAMSLVRLYRTTRPTITRL